jgi:exonuclease VII large subunit
MSSKLDNFGADLRERLRSAADRIESMNSSLESASRQGAEAMRTKLQEVRQNLARQKKQVDQKRAELKNWADQKMAETKESIAAWKERHDVAKLNSRADRSERYASDAIEYAAYVLDEAEEATLDAVVARIDAEDAQSSLAVSR